MAYDLSLDKINRRSRLVFPATPRICCHFGRSKDRGTPAWSSSTGVPNRWCSIRCITRTEEERPRCIMGPTGAGKSALLVYLLQQMAAMYRASSSSRPVVPFSCSARIFGGQRALGQQGHAQSNVDVSLPPFADLAHAGEGEPSSNHHRS